MNDGRVVARELVLVEQLTDFELDQFEELRVVHHVDLVEGDDDARHVHLAGQDDVLTRLGHGTIRRADHQDRAVHLGGAGDHVLDVVGVARAVDVSVVPGLRLILHVGDGNRHSAGSLLRRAVD